MTSSSDYELSQTAITLGEIYFHDITSADPAARGFTPAQLEIAKGWIVSGIDEALETGRGMGCGHPDMTQPFDDPEFADETSGLIQAGQIQEIDAFHRGFEAAIDTLGEDT
ncbi:MAG TPA: hypothetical protein VK674_07175 [Candidatus Limnocylindria bacterium]|nr:hypothetical protein [Candidatus Limnocylindria bacterium]